MSIIGTRYNSRKRGIPLLVTAFLLLTGCASEVETQKQLDFGNLLVVAYENLADRYISPLTPNKMSMKGLHNLVATDNSSNLRQEGGVISLTVDGTVVSREEIPEKDDINGWADVTIKLVNQARESSPSIGNLSDKETHNLLLAGIIKNADQYSRYLPSEAAGRSRATRDGFGGIGIVIELIGEHVLIQSVSPNNPAAKAGLLEGDRITHVDEKSILGLSISRVAKLFRGKVYEPVQIRIERLGVEKPLDLEVVRDHVIRESVSARYEDGTAIIRIKSFNQGTIGALRKSVVSAAREMGRDLKGLVLDLRSNPGGLLDQAIAVADLFLVDGRIISTKGRHPESNQIFDATPGEVLKGLPVVVLINGRSASAAEIVAVALRDSGRAAVIGSTSYGKGTVQTIVRLPNAAEYHLTWARILAPSGQTLDRQGIVPVICTNITRERIEDLKSALTTGTRKLMAVQSGYQPNSATPHYSKERKLDCPPSSVRPTDDLETAKLLLKNNELYLSAIAHPPTNLAKH